MKSTLVACSAALVLLLGVVPSAGAHGMYVAQRHGELAVVVGFSSNDEAYAVSKITAARAVTGNGRPLEVTRRDDPLGYVALKPPSGAALLFVDMDYGFYARDAAGKFKAGRKSALPGSVFGLQAIKQNLTVLGPWEGALRPRGKGLEIVPLESPLALQRGDSLKVQVLLDGSPLPGVRLWEDFVSNDALLSPETDKSGITRVRLAADTLNVIALEYDQKVSADPDRDIYRHFSTLSFSLNHPEPD
ncbi:DUF4198 domain-containing protein [Zoogloea sp. LCSB751]|uniref:DUF4198 domain-containing protein n=1 Tax=Zoogloea sp. LCSB751 TaxID=1965277 RepID=UPI00137479EF|nr:DUF4198 domain-containing protein [Zoogloea sp. LCSB751]